MNLSQILGGLSALNVLALRLAFGDPKNARAFISQSLRIYDELVGRGLEKKNLITYIHDQNLGSSRSEDRFEMPVSIADEGGTTLEEKLILARVTRVLRPEIVFEIGTYNGLTASIFAMNIPQNGHVLTLDLPPDTTVEENQRDGYNQSDLVLVERRRHGYFINDLNLADRCTQLYCDSMQFDPTPYKGSVQLGFIDGAHALPFVVNDTAKMAVMMDDRGIVFWHDYGGRGEFIRPLSEYLERLSRKAPIYRVRGTTLAWAPASSLRHLIPKP